MAKYILILHWFLYIYTLFFSWPLKWPRLPIEFYMFGLFPPKFEILKWYGYGLAPFSKEIVWHGLIYFKIIFLGSSLTWLLFKFKTDPIFDCVKICRVKFALLCLKFKLGWESLHPSNSSWKSVIFKCQL